MQPMHKYCWIALLTVAGCASGPAGPTLPSLLVYSEDDVDDNGGVLPITGLLELKIDPDGYGTSSVMRKVFTNVDRRSELSGEQLRSVVTLVDAWVKKGSEGPSVNAKIAFGSLSYGGKKVSWEKGAVLPPELAELVRFLKTIPPTLSVSARKR